MLITILITDSAKMPPVRVKMSLVSISISQAFFKKARSIFRIMRHHLTN